MMKKNNINFVRKQKIPGVLIIKVNYYQTTIITGWKKTNQNYLDPVFRDILQPIIDKLTSRQLLRHCLRVITQSSNESLNSSVADIYYNFSLRSVKYTIAICLFCYRSILSKPKHHDFRSVRGSAALVALFFNEGSNILVSFFNQCSISINKALFDHLLAKDNKRIIKFK